MCEIIYTGLYIHVGWHAHTMWENGYNFGEIAKKKKSNKPKWEKKNMLKHKIGRNSHQFNKETAKY